MRLIQKILEVQPLIFKYYNEQIALYYERDEKQEFKTKHLTTEKWEKQKEYSAYLVKTYFSKLKPCYESEALTYLCCIKASKIKEKMPKPIIQKIFSEFLL